MLTKNMKQNDDQTKLYDPEIARKKKDNFMEK
jgi:hypothetical protein